MKSKNLETMLHEVERLAADIWSETMNTTDVHLLGTRNNSIRSYRGRVTKSVKNQESVSLMLDNLTGNLVFCIHNPNACLEIPSKNYLSRIAKFEEWNVFHPSNELFGGVEGIVNLLQARLKNSFLSEDGYSETAESKPSFSLSC